MEPVQEQQVVLTAEPSLLPQGDGVGRDFNARWICISLITSEVEHISQCFLAIGNSLFISSARSLLVSFSSFHSLDTGLAKTLLLL